MSFSAGGPNSPLDRGSGYNTNPAFISSPITSNRPTDDSNGKIAGRARLLAGIYAFCATLFSFGMGLCFKSVVNNWKIALYGRKITVISDEKTSQIAPAAQVAQVGQMRFSNGGGAYFYQGVALVALDPSQPAQPVITKSDKDIFLEYEREASKGCAYNKFLMGWANEAGFGTPVNLKKAVEWYREAANQGYTRAQNTLGDLYTEGREGISKNDKEAFRWYKEAAESGNQEANIKLGDMYRDGRGVQKNDEKAVACYRFVVDSTLILPDKACNASGEEQCCVDYGSPVANYKLGYMYEHGLGVGKDIGKAAGLYQYAVFNGSQDAETALNGLRGNQDAETALKHILGSEYKPKE